MRVFSSGEFFFGKGSLLELASADGFEHNGLTGGRDTTGGTTGAVSTQVNCHQFWALLYLEPMLWIIVLVISQAESIIIRPKKVLLNISFPFVTRPGLAPPINMRNPAQTNNRTATGGIKPPMTKSIIFLRSWKRSQRVQGAVVEVPQGTIGQPGTSMAKAMLGRSNKVSTEINRNFLNTVFILLYLNGPLTR